ncbi:unnamed protein product [Rotaria sp. Silwood1]|nr:unnamed protein product [Rotaria sp. Silwood1]
MNLYRLVKPSSFLLSIIRYNHRTIPYPDITHPEQTIHIPETHEEKLALPLERPRFIDEYSLDGPPYGRVYEKIPFKYRVEKGRAYLYCACGWAHTQPFCDGMCKSVWGNHDVRRNPKFRPIKYVAEETKDVWWCNSNYNLINIDATYTKQIMSQSTTKQEYDQINDDIDDDELCRACDELYNTSQVVQSQQYKLSNIEQQENLTQNSSGLIKKH